jgi:putative tryptophan/tyrosine transport system substrate-binding protein
MRRRDFIIVFGSVAAASPAALRAQLRGDRPLIAWFSGQSQGSAALGVGEFQEGLRELGYTEGQNIETVYRFGDGREERLPAIADELVRLRPAVIVAVGVNAAVAVRNVTSTIPIVLSFLADAVHLGLIASVARPGGNVTGITPYVDGLPAKQMELARDVVPGAARVGILGNMNDPKAPPQRHELEDAARSLEVSVVAPEIRSPEDLAGAMEALARERVDAVIVLQTTMLPRLGSPPEVPQGTGIRHRFRQSGSATRGDFPHEEPIRPLTRPGNPRSVHCCSLGDIVNVEGDNAEPAAAATAVRLGIP